MTVKEMKELLATLPDNAILVMEDIEQGIFCTVDKVEDLTGDQECFNLCWGEWVR